MYDSDTIYHNGSFNNEWSIMGNLCSLSQLNLNENVVINDVFLTKAGGKIFFYDVECCDHHVLRRSKYVKSLIKYLIITIVQFLSQIYKARRNVQREQSVLFCEIILLCITDLCSACVLCHYTAHFRWGKTQSHFCAFVI